MHAHVLTAQFRPEMAPEAQQLFRTSVAPAILQLPGSKGLLYLSDPTTATVHVITLWDSEADMLAAERSGYLAQQFARMQAFVARPPTFASYATVSLQM